VKAPPIPAPQAIPEVQEATADEAMKKVRRASGFQKTILTGKLVPKQTGKNALLGA
jgi:hypothetical protein